MLTVHHLASSQSERIVWLCEELGLDYDLIRYERDGDSGMAPAAYKALHPAGTAPVITDGDVVLAESAAIAEYIARRHADGRLLLPPEHPDYADFLFWFHYANGSALPAIVREFIASGPGKAPPQGAVPERNRLDVVFDIAEARLAEAPWFAGAEFTAADVMMGYALATIRIFPRFDLAKAPHTAAYLERMRARPAYRAAMAKAEPGVAV